MSALRRFPLPALPPRPGGPWPPAGRGSVHHLIAEPPITTCSRRRRIQGMSLEDKIGQMFVLFAYGPDATARRPQHRPVRRGDAGRGGREYHPGGWIYFNARDNVQNPTQLATYSNQLQTAAVKTGLHLPLMIATDQEQGVVAGSARPPPSSAATWPTARPAIPRRPDRGRDHRPRAQGDGDPRGLRPGRRRERQRAQPGDRRRSFSRDPKLVSRHGRRAGQGLPEDAGIAATAKHFPGHGVTVDDSHTALPTINHTLRAVEHDRRAVVQGRDQGRYRLDHDRAHRGPVARPFR